MQSRNYFSNFFTGSTKAADTQLAALFYSDPSNMIQHVNLVKTKPRRKVFMLAGLGTWSEA